MSNNKKFMDPVSKHINKNRTHYLKWVLTDDISVRYHYLHQRKREIEGQFILKIHSKSSYNILDRDFAKQLIHSYIKDMGNELDNTFDMVAPDYEIIGALRKLEEGWAYHKTIIDYATGEVDSSIEYTAGINIKEESNKKEVFEFLLKPTEEVRNYIPIGNKIYQSSSNDGANQVVRNYDAEARYDDKPKKIVDLLMPIMIAENDSEKYLYGFVRQQSLFCNTQPYFIGGVRKQDTNFLSTLEDAVRKTAPVLLGKIYAVNHLYSFSDVDTEYNIYYTYFYQDVYHAFKKTRFDMHNYTGDIHNKNDVTFVLEFIEQDDVPLHNLLLNRSIDVYLDEKHLNDIRTSSSGWYSKHMVRSTPIWGTKNYALDEVEEADLICGKGDPTDIIEEKTVETEEEKRIMSAPARPESYELEEGLNINPLYNESKLFNEYFIFIIDDKNLSKIRSLNPLENVRIVVNYVGSNYMLPKTRTINAKRDVVRMVPYGFEEMCSYYGMEYLCSLPSTEADMFREIFRIKYIDSDVYDMNTLDEILDKSLSENLITPMFNDMVDKVSFLSEIKTNIEKYILKDIADRMEFPVDEDKGCLE